MGSLILHEIFNHICHQDPEQKTAALVTSDKERSCQELNLPNEKPVKYHYTKTVIFHKVRKKLILILTHHHHDKYEGQIYFNTENQWSITDRLTIFGLLGHYRKSTWDLWQHMRRTL